jgi:hypothetical protein
MNATARCALLATTLLLACHSASVLAATGKPILVTTPNSTRAVAFEAVSFTPEPFTSKASSLIYGTDRATRIMLFALNLSLKSDNDAAAMTANAEDANHRKYDLTVEYVGRVQGLPWLTMVVVRLDETMGDLGDVLVQTKYGGVAGNRVRIGIGHVGGGPPDDSGAMPTPAPPYILKGQITLGGAPFGGVTVRLSEAVTAEATTDNNGTYSFTIPAVGDYIITPAQRFFNFTPLRAQFIDLANTQTVNFVAVRDTFVVNGIVRNDQGSGVDGVSVKLERAGMPPISFVTSNGGAFSFPDLPAGYQYTVTPQTTSLLAFSSQTIVELDRNVSLNFSGILRTYSISGLISDLQQHGVDGVAVQLSGAATAITTTDANGRYSVNDLLAGRNYTITGTRKFFTVTPANIQVTNLSNPVDASFTAVRDTWTISGTVKSDEGQSLDGVVISLESSEGGSSTRTVSTGNGGAFSFDVPAGFNYSIRPTNTSIFAFTQQTVNELSQNVTVNFDGIRRNYAISGFISDQAQHGVGGVAVQLSGAATATTTTDSNGNYSFNDLLAGRNYTLTGSKGFFTVTPASIAVTNLSNPVDVSFTAVRDKWTISGIVKSDEGEALDGVAVILRDSGGSPRTVHTSNGGAFAFNDLPAGDNYLVRPPTTSVFTFTQQTVNELSQNVIVNFNGARRTYTISGFISDKAQHGFQGVAVQLSGAATASTTTDAGGNYAFTNLFAGRDYTVTANKTDHFVNPISPSFTLLRDELVDFSAIRFYVITGRVTDNDRGLHGINLSITGPEVSSVRTANDGSYSIVVTTTGDYVLTPSREQDFYQFSPTQQNLNVADHMRVDFDATLVITGPTYVLEFDGTPMTVDYGYFWPAHINVGHFFWEFWAMPGTDTFTRYLISDGYGGAHAILFGFNYGPAGHYNLFGNIWNGAPNFYFYSDDGPAPGEWGHYAVGWDGQNVVTYYDGVPVGKQAFTGPRSSTSQVNGSNLLLIGGSDHQNLIGRIAQVRAYEENNPRASAPESSFSPETVFSVDGQFLTYFFHPATVIPDLSYGYGSLPHDGRPRGVQNGYILPCNGCPTPRFVIDPSAPNFANPDNPGSVTTLIDTPPPVPSGAQLFDSFSRNNSTYILNGKGGLGSTETGAQTWRTNVEASQPQPFGILSGRTVVLVNETALAWVNVAVSDMDVRVSRTNGRAGSGSNTGLCFRVLDKNNFFFAYSHDDQIDPSGPKKLAIGYYAAGVRIILGDDITLPSDWTVLRVVTNSNGTVMVYADDSQVYTTNNSLNAALKGAGIFNYGPGLGLQNRWDNFTIFDVP